MKRAKRAKRAKREMKRAKRAKRAKREMKREKHLYLFFATSVSSLLISRYLRDKPPNYGENKVKRVELVSLEQM